MAENFDLIFGQNASQQYAWNDADYQNGWGTIGNIPPTAAQFDALQRRNDTKAQELNSRLVNVEQSIAGGGSQKREPDTEYTVGTILIYDDLPMDWVLECIVGGISSANDITIPSPRVEGARILDGTVTWALRKIATYGGVGYRQSSTACPIGSIAFSTSLPAGWYLECTTPGTTPASDLVITSPTVGATVTDGTVVWTVRKIADTTEATTTTKGLMSAADKTKLNGIANNANNYSLPAATGSTRGGVTVGSNISLSGDKISLTSGNVTNALGYTPPSTTGANASGSWNINAATATNADNATHASSADSATNADKVDGVHAASLFYNKGNWDGDANNWATIGAYQVNGTLVSGANGWGQVISSSTDNARFQLYAAHKFNYKDGRLHYRTGWGDVPEPWNTILDSENYNLFVPTKTGEGASGTWGINISGDADKLDGYHASDIINKISAANTGGIVAASLTANGYVKFANGLILQWGVGSGDSSGISATFPIQFPNKCVFGTSEYYLPDSRGHDYWQATSQISDMSTTGCKLGGYNASSGTKIAYMVIGY